MQYRPADPYIDIIVLSYGKFYITTKRCLDSIISGLDRQTYGLIVVDNCSKDGSRELLKSYLARVTDVTAAFLDENLGFAGGMNSGASLSTAEWLLLVNSDTIFPQGSLDAFSRVLRAQPPSVGMVGPITNNAGTGQCYGINGGYEEVMPIADSLQKLPSSTLISAPRLDFFCVAIRSSLWKRLNGLDVSYGLGYYEDLDFSFRASKLGARLLISEDVFVYHAGSLSFSSNEGVNQLIKKNKVLFQKRFPAAKLLHHREDNYRILKHYLSLGEAGSWSPAIEARLRLRISSLKLSRPKSPLKRLIWKMRTRSAQIAFNRMIKKHNLKKV